MSFFSPSALYLFLPLIGLVLMRMLRKTDGALRFSSLAPILAAGKSLRQRLLWLPPLLEVAAASALILALARPREEVRGVDKITQGIAIEMVMDISSSMTISMRRSTFGESRLDVAKQTFEDFVAGDRGAMPGRGGDLIGLTTFARYPNTICPLTFSHDILLYFVRRLEIEDRPNEDGTAFGDAVALAAARLQDVGDRIERLGGIGNRRYDIKSKVVVLLTDGDNNCGRHLPLEAAAMARKWGVRVYTIGFGEAREDVDADSPPLNATERILREMADMTGGIFRRAYDADSLRAVYAEIDRLEKTGFVEESYIDYRELYHVFAAAGLGCFLLAMILKHTCLRLTR